MENDDEVKDNRRRKWKREREREKRKRRNGGMEEVISDD